MREAVLLACVLVANVVGLAWLALGLRAHWRQVRGDQPLKSASVRILRILGASSLAISLGLCLTVDHATIAALVWIMALASAALIVTFTLSWRPRSLAFLVAWCRPARD